MLSYFTCPFRPLLNASPSFRFLFRCLSVVVILSNFSFVFLHATVSNTSEGNKGVDVISVEGQKPSSPFVDFVRKGDGKLEVGSLFFSGILSSTTNVRFTPQEDTGMAMGFVEGRYETASLEGFRLGAGWIGLKPFWEKDGDDFESSCLRQHEWRELFAKWCSEDGDTEIQVGRFILEQTGLDGDAHQGKVMTLYGFEGDFPYAISKDETLGVEGAYVLYANRTPTHVRAGYEDVHAWLVHGYWKKGDLMFGAGWHGSSNNRGHQGAGIFDWIDPLTVDEIVPYSSGNNAQLFYTDAKYKLKQSNFIFRYGYAIDRSIAVHSHEVNLIAYHHLTPKLGLRASRLSTSMLATFCLIICVSAV